MQASAPYVLEERLMKQRRLSTIVWKVLAALFAVAVASGPAFAQIGYVRSDGINSVVYQGSDQHVYELYLLGNQWQLGDLTYLTGAPLAYSVPQPYVRSDNVSSVVYAGADGHIYEIYLWGGTWYYGDLTAISGAPLGADPHPYVRADQINSIVYVGQNQHIYEIYLYGGWHWGDLTAVSGAPPIFNGLHPYVSSNKISSVLYVAGDGHSGSLHQIYEIYLGRRGWSYANLTALAGAPDANAVPFVTPHPFVRSDGVDSIVYPRGAQAGWPIFELYPQAGAWHYDNLSDLSQAPLGNWNLNPYVRSDGISAVVYSGGTVALGGDGHLRELFYDFGGWHFDDLTDQAGAPLVDTNYDPHPYVRADGLNAVLYWSSGHVIELYWSPAYTSWQYEDLTAQAGG